MKKIIKLTESELHKMIRKYDTEHSVVCRKVR